MARLAVYAVVLVSVIVVFVAVSGRTLTANVGAFHVEVAPATLDEPTDLSQEPAPALGAGSLIASTDQIQWSIDFLAARGIAEPAPESILFVTAWQQTEGTAAQWNPLATSKDMPGATLFNGDGVKNYRTRQDGIDAAARTLDEDHAGYAEIARGLELGDPDLALQGIAAGAWGSQAPTLASVYNELAAEYRQPPAASAPAVAGPSGRCKAPPTWPVNITASFWDTESPAWSSQWGGFHLGDDFGAPQGSPVYAPFDLWVDTVAYYDDPATRGWYVAGHLADGAQLYMGHLQHVTVAAGGFVPCGVQFAETGEYNHTHVRLAAPGTPTPCESLAPGWSSGCVDFVAYYNSQ